MNSSTLPASGAAIRLDDLDHRVLDELSRDGRLSNTDLAHRIGLSPSACWTRVRALEERWIVSALIIHLAARAWSFAYFIPKALWFEKLADLTEDQERLARAWTRLSRCRPVLQFASILALYGGIHALRVA
jgi:DNA-binding Lrp family transcriptional regulator